MTRRLRRPQSSPYITQIKYTPPPTQLPTYQKPADYWSEPFKGRTPARDIFNRTTTPPPAPTQGTGLQEIESQGLIKKVYTSTRAYAAGTQRPYTYTTAKNLYDYTKEDHKKLEDAGFKISAEDKKKLADYDKLSNAGVLKNVKGEIFLTVPTETLPDNLLTSAISFLL